MTSALEAEKTRLRALLRERLAAVPARSRAAKSERIVARLEAAPEVAEAKIVLLHRALPTEVAIDGLLAVVLEGARSAFVPVVDGAQVRFVRVLHDTPWRRSTRGVLEPTCGDALDLRDLQRFPSVVVVPGLAFDSQGGRLGRGGGHYDRFLHRARDGAFVRTIGVAFDLQIVAEVPRLDHDEPVDAVVTESRTISRSAG